MSKMDDERLDEFISRIDSRLYDLELKIDRMYDLVLKNAYKRTD